MNKKIKRLARYVFAYKVYGLILYIRIFWFKAKVINLKGFGKIHIRPDTFDPEVFTQMFVYKQYDFGVYNDVKIVVDLGGNNGMSSIFFHRKYPAATIYVLEPDKENYKALQKNIAGIDKIIPLNKAIWKEDGFVNLDSGDSWAIKVDTKGTGNLAEAITMDTLMKTYKINQIDILKIDIESAEKEMFESDIAFMSSTRNLMIELHDWIREGCAQSFFNALNGFSYTYALNYENTLITNLQVKNSMNKNSAREMALEAK